MARLLSVNVGLPRDVAWNGKTVRTAVWKLPAEGRRMVRKLNIDGDGQGDLAGHGGEQRAVLVYQRDSYRFWQKQLGRDDLAYGQFGENFTVDGLPDDEVCIGDKYRIGDAVFEVTQPRVTCYRVGIRLNEPRMAALLVAHRRPGFYLRVLVEGRVQAGDEIVKVGSGPEGMSVAEIDALLYLPGHPREQLVRALRIPALSPGWKTSLRALLDQADDQHGSAIGNPGLSAAGGSPAPAWDGFRPLRVVRIVPESQNIFSLHLASPDGAPLPAALPGQFLALRLRPEVGGGPLIRSYSLSGRPGAAEYRISVKQEPFGAGSSYLRTHIRAGDTLDVAAPRGTFTLRAGDRAVILLSAGVGVTPVLAMLHALAAERSTRQVWWLHGARNGAEHAFAAEVRELLVRLPNARSHVCYSKPAPTDGQGSDYTSVGRMSAEMLGNLDLPRAADAYLCGPAEFMRDATAALVASGIDPSYVHTEIFGAGPTVAPGVRAAPTLSPHPPASGQGTGPSVSFARSGLTVNWDSGYATVLELAEACSVPTRWSCRTGVCHTCETSVLSGAVDYSLEPIEAPGDGNALICCSRPRGDIVLDL